MGCSTSKLDDKEAVQLCKDRKRFIKQAVEQRAIFASEHLAYIQAIERVSAALRDYIEGDDARELLLDSFITPPFTPMKKTSSSFITISSKSFSPVPQPNPTIRVNYLRSGGNPAVSVEEMPQLPETGYVQNYSPVHQYGMDGMFAMQSSPMNSSSFFSYSPNNRPDLPPPLPQSLQWDFFWNPFTSLDHYGYLSQSSFDDQTAMDNETGELKQVREEEGVPDSEEVETEKEGPCTKEENAKIDSSCSREEVTVADVDVDENDDEHDKGEKEEKEESHCETDVEHDVKGLQSHASASLEVSQGQNGEVEMRNQETASCDGESKEEAPDFTVYASRRPTSMAEVIKDLETQFTIVCNSAKEISTLLEASRAQYSSTPNEITAMKMLNPVALFHSRDEGYESSSSDFSEDPSKFCGNLQSTLDRLYAWEKKLYEEVRVGEKVKIAYEKKCMQLRNQEVKGEDSSAVDKTRAAITDLHTQIKVSIHSVEAISSRIETLRDEELQPQLVELVQGLARMWKIMAECHQMQKRILDEAKLLLAGSPSKLDAEKHSSMNPQRLTCSAVNLETELRKWRACFESWIASQRSYVHALAGWLLLCVQSDPDTSKLPFYPRRSSKALPVFGICIQWARSLDAIQETPVLEGLDFFAAGMGSLHGQQLKEDSRQVPIGSKRYRLKLAEDKCGGDMELVEVGDGEEEVTGEKVDEFDIRVVCAGMSAAISSLTEFAIGSAEGYAALVKQWEQGDWPPNSSDMGVHCPV